jgi:hypothetical protein
VTDDERLRVAECSALLEATCRRLDAFVTGARFTWPDYLLRHDGGDVPHAWRHSWRNFDAQG